MRSLLLLLLSMTLMSGVDADALRARVLDLLQEEFTDARLETRDGRLCFARGARDFIVYRADKGGRWQDPQTNSGPDSGGFMLSFFIAQEPWSGAAELPLIQTEDFHVFRESRVIKETRDRRGYLWAEILDPPHQGHAKLHDRLMELFSNFDGR
jgi:hypothetical protein